MENYNEVLEQLQDYGLEIESLQIDTPKPVRCRIRDDATRKKRGWYWLSTFTNTKGQQLIVGSYGAFWGPNLDKHKVKLPRSTQKSLTPEERKAIASRIKENQKRMLMMRQQEIERAALKATKIWSALVPELPKSGHEYLARKRVGAHGVRFSPETGAMAVPMRDAAGRIYGLQIIRGHEQLKGRKLEKEYWPAGLEKKGHFHLIGGHPNQILLIAEGYATAATLYEAAGFPVAVAFDAGNLLPVAEALRKAYPNCNILVCADDDRLQKCSHCGVLTDVNIGETCQHCGKPHGKSNAGVIKATQAAMAVNGQWVKPDFGVDENGQDARGEKRLSDFNDLANFPSGGAHVVRAQIESALKRAGWLSSTSNNSLPPAENADNMFITDESPIDEPIPTNEVLMNDTHTPMPTDELLMSNESMPDEALDEALIVDEAFIADEPVPYDDMMMSDSSVISDETIPPDEFMMTDMVIDGELPTDEMADEMVLVNEMVLDGGGDGSGGFANNQGNGSEQPNDKDGRPDAQPTMSLDKLVERFIFVDDDTGEYVFDTWTHSLVRFTKMRRLMAPKLNVDDVKNHPVWLSRAVYLDEIGFDPAGTDPKIKHNLWRGWPLKPKQGKCDNILGLLLYLCNNDAQVYEWVLKWLAYPLQHPGTKMHTALVFHGPQGVGKNLFFERCMGPIYGEYAVVLNSSALEDSFNADWASRKLFVIADEVVASNERYHLKNQLKNLITSDTVRINPKNVIARQERNHMNFVFLSNEHIPLILDPDDRRHMVVWTPEKASEQDYLAIEAEIANGGVEALYYYLLNLDLGNFKPWTKPIETESKQQLQNLTKETPRLFAESWLAGELDIPLCPAKSNDVYVIYQRWVKEQGEPFARPQRQFVAHLSKMGWRYSVSKVKLPDGSYKAVRALIPDKMIMRRAEKNGVKVLPQQEGESIGEWLSRTIKVMAARAEQETVS